LILSTNKYAKPFIKPSQNFNITTKAYKNDFARNWYKLDALKIEPKVG
jgi:hypothetical protein